MTIFGKIDHLHASTENHFLPVCESYIHALSRNTKCLTIDGQVFFYGWPFADAVEPQWMHFLPLRSINRTAWDTKLLLTAVLSSPVDCISLCQILRAKHSSLSPNGWFTPPSAPHPLTPIDSIRDITGAEKSYLKNQQHSSS